MHNERREVKFEIAEKLIKRNKPTDEIVEDTGWPVAVLPGVTYLNVLAHGKPSTAVFGNGLTTVSLTMFSAY